MGWTREQSEAIETTGKNLLVAAAAGSGKTAVLVQRIIGLVLSGACDVDELLVVTFTHAAAEEMRTRLEAALTARLEEERDGQQCIRLERQLVLLSGASIQTIDSFCQSILRRSFAELDLDPKFRVAGEQELRLIQQDVLEELFERKYDEGREDFLAFADACGGSERGDEALYRLVLKLYGFSQSQPFPEEWLAELPEAFELQEGEGLKDTPWYEAVREEIRLTLETAGGGHGEAMELAEALGADFYAENLQEDGELLDALQDALQSSSWMKLYEAFQTHSFGKLKNAPKGTADEVKKPVQKARDSYKKRIQGIQEKYFRVTEEELLEDLRQAAPMLRELTGVTLEFLRDYGAAKHEKSIVDFSDLEHFALNILSSGGARDEAGRLVPSAAALELQAKYKTVMVDEYQDTNGVQEAILQLAAGEKPGSFFAVGDVKQSIYRFRLADPGLFLKKYLEYPEAGENYARIDLSRNFRSRAGVLAAVNFIFAQVMVPGTMELSYDRAAMLYPGLEYPEYRTGVEKGKDTLTLEGPTELALLVDDEPEDSKKAGKEESETEDGEEEEELRGAALEAQYIAGRLREFHSKGTPVYHADTGDYQPFHWRDAVILLRSVKGIANEMMEVLQKNDIPAYASVDAGYFEAQEIRVMLALLSVLDNARQDIPLAGVLLSPIGGFSAEDLSRIRLEAPEEDIYTALLRCGSPEVRIEPELARKTAQFADRLTRWRNLSRELSVPELIWQLYRDTGYYDYAGGLPGGLLKQANLRMLVDRAAAYEKTNFRGLFRFLRFVERMREMDTDLAAARTLGESEDVVRIMSIHKSKGLEFPLVFVAALGRKFNLMDASRPLVLMHRELGLGPYRVDLEGPMEYPTFARQAIAQKLCQESKAEEMRILYVALTRAREKLVLVGSAGKREKLAQRADRWCRYVNRTACALPDYAVTEAGSFLDWIASAAARHSEGAVLREAAETPRQWAPILDYEDSSHWEVRLVSTGDVRSPGQHIREEDEFLRAVRDRKSLPETSCREAVEKVLDWKYDRKGLEGLPAKMSVTELKRRFAAEDEAAVPMFPAREEICFRRPDFRGEQQSRMTGAEYGTMMHSVMQHIDLRGDLSALGIRNQLENMAEQGLLKREHVGLIRYQKIAEFFSSPLGKRLCSGKEVYRELPFTRMMPAGIFSAEAENSSEHVLIQGIIDVLFRDQDGVLVLLDYKTDGDTDPIRAAARHRVQMTVYREALGEILGEEVGESYLYMLQDGTLIPMGD